VNTIPYTWLSNGVKNTVEAVQPVPGLYVYQLPEGVRHPDFPWMVGHASGLAIAAFPQQSDALAAVTLISDLTDWSMSEDQLRTEVDVYELWDLIEDNTTGMFIVRQPIDAESAA
jgi:hypothetical protein